MYKGKYSILEVMHVPRNKIRKNGQEEIIGPASFIPLLIIATVSKHVRLSCKASRAAVWFNAFWRKLSLWQVSSNNLFVSHSDPCRMHQNSLNIICVYDAQTQKVQSLAPPSACPSDPEPLCASDGRSYNSECQMQRTALQKDRQLKKVHSGPCKKQGESQKHWLLHTCSFLRTRPTAASDLFSHGCSKGQALDKLSWVSSTVMPARYQSPQIQFACRALAGVSWQHWICGCDEKILRASPRHPAAVHIKRMCRILCTVDHYLCAKVSPRLV